MGPKLIKIDKIAAMKIAFAVVLFAVVAVATSSPSSTPSLTGSSNGNYSAVETWFNVFTAHLSSGNFSGLTDLFDADVEAYNPVGTTAIKGASLLTKSLQSMTAMYTDYSAVCLSKVINELDSDLMPVTWMALWDINAVNSRFAATCP